FVRRIPAGALSEFAGGELRTDNYPDGNKNWLLKHLYSNGDLEGELSRLVESLFSTPVFLDRQNFPPRIRAGEVGVAAPPANAITAEYSKASAMVPALDDQGDGIRSFTGLALVVLALSPEVLLLDEPESFLHPGQARAVGRWLAEVAHERNIQVLASTHDKDFLIGLLSAGRNESLQVLRIDRHSGGSSLRATTSDQLNGYWNDPVLRFSNILQGLFHERVIVCEGDVDCRFYAAVGEELAIQGNRRQITDNTLFVPSSGKNGMPKLLGVLADLGVDASVIADFDVLNSVDTLKAIVCGLGSEWDAELDAAYAAAVKHISVRAAEFWKDAKNAGLNSVPRGEATRAFSDLVEQLRARRLHVVPVGELEDFHRPVGKGPEWLPAALTAGAHKGDDVRKLLAQVIPGLED
ncbi:AAA family ATPase, partial [Microbacterium sp. Mu-80]